MPHQLVVFLALFTAAFLLGLDPTGRGLFVVLLAWVVVVMLGRHRAEGGGRQWFKAAAEYAVVAGLVFAVMTAMPAPADQPKPKPKARAEASQPDHLAELRARWDALWERVGKVKFSDAPLSKEGR